MKIYINLTQAKILYSVFKLFANGVKSISRRDLIVSSGVDKSNLSKEIHSNHILKERLKNG